MGYESWFPSVPRGVLPIPTKLLRGLEEANAERCVAHRANGGVAEIATRGSTLVDEGRRKKGECKWK